MLSCSRSKNAPELQPNSCDYMPTSRVGAESPPSPSPTTTKSVLFSSNFVGAVLIGDKVADFMIFAIELGKLVFLEEKVRSRRVETSK